MATKTAKNKIHWTKPADQNPEITIDDFKDMVKEAEKGPFYSLTEFKQKMKLWRKENLQKTK
ncbi:MAG: hypothetical protein JXR36_09560 [Bacteroidales bacterium]|nr:hypothetical protein [Bacteroidales bacterium]